MPSNSHPVVHPHTLDLQWTSGQRHHSTHTNKREEKANVGGCGGRVYRARVSYQPAITRSQRLSPLRDDRLPAVEQCFQASISVARPFSKTPRAGGRRKMDIGPLPNPPDGGTQNGRTCTVDQLVTGKTKKVLFLSPFELAAASLDSITLHTHTPSTHPTNNTITRSSLSRPPHHQIPSLPSPLLCNSSSSCTKREIQSLLRARWFNVGIRGGEAK